MFLLKDVYLLGFSTPPDSGVRLLGLTLDVRFGCSVWWTVAASRGCHLFGHM